jgi:hypothetical protein
MSKEISKRGTNQISRLSRKRGKDHEANCEPRAIRWLSISEKKENMGLLGRLAT